MQLDDDRLRKIANWKLDGYTNEEIGAMLQCSRATVARKLAIIRKTWEERDVQSKADDSRLNDG